MEPRQFLALDIGDKQTGLARGSSVARLAEPLPSVLTNDLLALLPKLIKESSYEAIVIGLPRNLAGQESAQTAKVRQWVVEAKPKIKLPFYWQDEALTSRHAAGQLAKSQKPKAKSQIDEHSLAAAIFLQDFLDSSEAERQIA